MFAGLIGVLGAAGPGEQRQKAEALQKEGNWKDALAIYEELLADENDDRSGQDLAAAVLSLQALNQQSSRDELVESTLEARPDNWRVLYQAGMIYQGGPSWGRMLDGEFQRGQNNGGGSWVDASERDRVRAMQLYLKALAKGEETMNAGERVSVLNGLISALTRNRTHGSNLWSLAIKTPLDVLPDYGDGRGLSSGSGAPVDDEGNPVYFSIPESWGEAANDGERWRSLREEVRRLNPGNAVSLDFEWANFLRQNYGVGTLAGFGWWGRGQGSDESKGILEAHTLSEEETLAKMADGVKRFTLREDYQFIPLYRRLYQAKNGNASAGDALVQVLLDRRQYVAAAKELRQVIERHGAGGENSRRKLLKQITGDWGRFESVPMFGAGKKPSVPFVFRNAESVNCELHRIKLDLLVSDIFEHIESNPKELDWSKINVGSVGQQLVQQEKKRYLGEKLESWEVKLDPRKGHWDTRTSIKVPTSNAGAYLLKARLEDGNTSWIVVWISDTVLLRHQTKEDSVFYLGDSDGATGVAGEIEFLGFKVVNREGAKRLIRKFDIVTKKFRHKVGEDGLLKLPKGSFDRSYRWMAVGRGEGERMALMGFYSHYWRDYHWQGWSTDRSYGITDRPVYRPGQPVKIKFWSRSARYDLDDVSVYAGKAARVEIHHQQSGKVHEAKNLNADDYGGVELEFELPEDAKLGEYFVRIEGSVPGGSINFRVEEYKKPEYEVTVEGPKEPISLGEKVEATVKATYYHGAPVTEAKVKVKVQRYSHTERWFPAGPWDWLYGRGYWWCGQEYEWYPGWNDWGCVAPPPPWWGGNRWAPPELILDREFEISKDGTVKVEIDTEIAKLVHGDMDHRYEVTAEVVDASRRTIVGSGSVLAARQPFSVTTWLDRGYARPAEPVSVSFAAKTLDGRSVEAEGKVMLYQVTLGEDGKVGEKLVKEWKAVTDEKGEGAHVFKAPSAGQYRVAVSLTDAKGNKQEGGTVFVVRGEKDKGQGLRFNDLELVLDKKHYEPGETAKILINTNRADATVLLFLRGAGNVAEKLELIRMPGKSMEYDLKLEKRDMPNTFIEAVTIARGRVVSQVREIVLPPEKRILNVEVLPGKTKYKPREKAEVTIRLTNGKGEPFVGSTVLTVYDKSLEYISGGSNVPDIRSVFWNWKRGYSRGALAHSQTLGGSHLVSPKGDRMQLLGRFGGMVADVPGAQREVLEEAAMDGGGGALGGVESLRFSRAEAKASEAPRDMVMEGDFAFLAKHAANGAGTGPAQPEVMVRSEFADLVKWVGSVETNDQGEAVIELDMPDNLTTWKVKTWAMGHGTRVGEGSAEIITSKDLIVRLQAPRFFIEGDRVTLSAVVHNYHEEAKQAKVSLEIEGGTVDSEGGTSSEVVIPAGGEQRVDWTVVARKEGEVTLRMMAVAKDDADAMEMTFPVYVHGMARTESWSRAIAPDGKSAVIDFEIPDKRRPSETRLELRYSPTIATAMVDALPYLASYPYGCTEQTLNRFVPTVITQKILKDMEVDLAAVRNKRVNLNPQEVGDPQERGAQWKQWQSNPVWDEGEVAEMVRVGVQRLREMQNEDGGWGWFSAYGEHSYPHTTAVVVNGLLIARDNGADVPAEMLQRGVEWLERYESKEAEKIRMWGKRKRNVRKSVGPMDAMLREILGRAGVGHEEMLGFLIRDKVGLPVYAKCLVGLELHRVERFDERDAVIRNVEQFLKKDPENQTAYLDLGNHGYWWYWYGNEFEAHASYLKLLAAVRPDSEEARGVVKYLVNNRKNATYWRSTRDTAYCIDALASYLRASGETAPELEVEVLLDGKVLKTVAISKENLFSFDGTAIVAGDLLTAGKHRVEFRKKGSGPLYANAYLTVFTLEDFIEKAGLEVKVERSFYKMVPVDASEAVAGSKGQALSQKSEKFERVPLSSGDRVESGDLIEVELSIESKNDYTYLMFEDWKAAGLEPVEVRSGHSANGLGAFMELRDEKVALFVRSLPRGRHNLCYQLRAEIPGQFSAMPTRAEAMYAPELKANSDEMKIMVKDR